MNTFSIILTITAFAAAIAATAILLHIRLGPKKRSKKKTAKCTKETIGTITKRFIPADSYNTQVCIRAEYKVNGTAYKIDEYLTQYKEKHPEAKYKRDRTQYKYCINGKVGDAVTIMYDPENPKRAYLKDNNGVSALHKVKQEK